MGVLLPLRLKTVEDYILSVHGSARQLTATELMVMRTHVRGIELAIEAASPVDTGRFRDGWESQLGVVNVSGVMDFSRIGFTISNTVGYSQYVHYSGTISLFWRSTVPLIMSARVPAMIASLKVAIDVTEAATSTAGQGIIDLIQSVQRIQELTGGV